MGIPIGPDTSLLIAEILLSAVDKRIRRKLPTARAFRFMDDYEFAVASREHAELALAVVQEALSEYELALSPEKTNIASLPCSLDEEWLAPLRDYRFVNSSSRQASQLIAYFNSAYNLAKGFPGKPVLAYAISRMRSVTIQPGNWEVFQDLLFQSVLAEPGTLPPVLRQLIAYRNLGWAINTAGLSDVANLQIAYQAPLGHASEVAWALWTILVFRLNVRNAAAKAVSLMSDSVVALLALDAREQSLVLSGMTTELWESYLTQPDLYGGQWLLCYEASIKGWLSSSSGDHIGADNNFAWLRAIGVEFYDAAQTQPPGVQPEPEDITISHLDTAVDAMVDPYGEEATSDPYVPDVSEFSLDEIVPESEEAPDF